MEEGVEGGATMYTDEHGGYAGLTKAGFKRETINHSVKEFVNGKCHFNGLSPKWRRCSR